MGKGGAAYAKRCRLRHAGRSAKSGGQERIRRTNILFLFRQLPEKVRRESGAVCREKVRATNVRGSEPERAGPRKKELYESRTKTKHTGPGLRDAGRRK